ncbi:MAG: hypothetical protein HFACDABA_01938 [Anaerolineales bacterium]|nr:hypothetical protein [Anaerolineales bacterium]
MKRLPHFLSVSVSLLLTGCLTVFVPVETPTPTPTAQPTAAGAPTMPPITAAAPPTQAQSAPVCSVDPLVASCAAPQVEERSKYCVEKYPYVQFAVEPGVTFESLSPDMKCSDQGIRGGDQVIACTGQYLIAYDMKVCSAACSASALIVDDRCAQGYGFSADAGCCWPLPTDDAGCVLVKVNIGACR